jgi:hypothetical protein
MGTIWEVGLADFLLVTLFLGGGAAYLTGRAVASVWSPMLQMVVYVVGLTCAVRFIHYALFGGTLLSLQYYLVDLVILLILGTIGFRITKTNQMVRQYSWLYERAGPFGWRQKSAR